MSKHRTVGRVSKLKTRMPKPRTWWILLAVACSLGFLSGLIMLVATPGTVRVTTSVPLSDILKAADEGDVEAVNVSSGASVAFLAPGVTQIAGVAAQDVDGQATVSFIAPAAVQNTVLNQLLADGVEVRFTAATGTATVAAGGRGAPTYTDPSTRPAWLTPAAVGLMIASGIGLAASLVKARRAKKDEEIEEVPTTPAVTFADVAGADEAVESLAEMVEFLKDPTRFTEVGARVPAGAILVGPPGTGKTLLAKAVAGEAGVAFFATSGSEFTEMYVGVGPKRVRSLFARARKAGKAVVFIDEIDAVARKRSEGGSAGGHQEAENTMMALLTEMDGFTDRGGIIVLAATNRPDILDPALLRPGRLDRRVEVPLPDRRGRAQILNVHASKVPLGVDVDIAAVAARTPGFSGASLAAVVNEAAIEAARRGLRQVTSSCFDTAVAQVAMGKARTSALVSEHDREVTAWHEAGHTVAALLLADADKPVAVSIIPRGPAGGVTWMSEGDDLFLTRAKAHARLIVALSGRAGEQMLMDGEFTQGASGDLDSATNLALLMTTRYGMTRLGLAAREHHLGGTGTTQVADVVEELLQSAAEAANTLLRQHADLVSSVAEALLEREDLSANELAEIAENHGVQANRVNLPQASIPAKSVSDHVHAGTTATTVVFKEVPWWTRLGAFARGRRAGA